MSMNLSRDFTLVGLGNSVMFLTLLGRGLIPSLLTLAKEIDIGHSKLTLFEFNHESVILEAVEEGSEVFFVFVGVLACHQDVIEVDEQEV